MIEPSSKQKEYLRAIEKHDLCFLTGAAGTGKTYIACSSALHFLEKGAVDKIVITRPLVATEEVGFLPGTLEEKISPFMDPILGLLAEIYDSKSIKKMVEEGVIESAPLAYMRGRTFKDSFVILDEAQNTTRAQISMFLTRFGINTKACVVGDLKQSDLINPRDNGLRWARKKLAPSTYVTNVEFDESSVVRSPLVKDIMKYLYADEETQNTSQVLEAAGLERFRA